MLYKDLKKTDKIKVEYGMYGNYITLTDVNIEKVGEHEFKMTGKHIYGDKVLETLEMYEFNYHAKTAEEVEVELEK